MKPSQSGQELQKRLGQPLATVTSRHALEAMFAFYAEQRAEDVEPDDGDMLLFEWGVYSFTAPETIQIGVTRQFIVADEEDEEEIFQLHLTMHFPATDELRQLNDGNKWCHSPDELPEFKRFVESSPFFRTVADLKPLRVELYFEQC